MCVMLWFAFWSPQRQTLMCVCALFDRRLRLGQQLLIGYLIYHLTCIGCQFRWQAPSPAAAAAAQPPSAAPRVVVAGGNVKLLARMPHRSVSVFVESSCSHWHKQKHFFLIRLHTAVTLQQHTFWLDLIKHSEQNAFCAPVFCPETEIELPF